MKLSGALLFPIGVVAFGLVAGCVTDAPTSSSLQLTKLDSSTIAGVLQLDGSEIAFESSSVDQRRVALRLDVNGAEMRFTYDIDGKLTEDGQHNTLYGEDLSALLELRDSINRDYPRAVQGSLQGMFLSRHADWLADAPRGYAVEVRAVDVQDQVANAKSRVVANTTHDDSANTTCLRPGVTYRAYYDAGNGGAQWMWDRVANSGSCLGRCGAGCNIFDTDLMLDCLEHDTCVDHFGGSVFGDSPNCGDEFNHAIVEYTVTLGAWCPF